MSDDVKYVDVYASTATVAPLSTAPLATVRRFESVTTSDHTTTRVTRVHNVPVPSIARDGITAHGWTFTSVKGSISPAADIDAFEKHTGVKVPEMVYLANALVLSHEATGSVFSFNAKDALAACALPVSAEKSKGESYQGTTNAMAATSATTITTPLLPHSLSQPCSSSSSPRPSLASLSSSPVPATSTSRPVQVKMASAWKNRDLPSDLEQIEMTYDWTYTPAYKGTLFFNRSPSPTSCSTPSASSPSSFCLPPSSSPSSFTAIPLPLVPTDAALDMDLMRRKDQIVWFDDVLLYEDELHDNGVSKLSVKVMLQGEAEKEARVHVHACNASVDASVCGVEAYLPLFNRCTCIFYHADTGDACVFPGPHALLVACRRRCYARA